MGDQKKPLRTAGPARRGSAEASSSQVVTQKYKYVLPLPVRRFPLPTFYPSNPVSLLHLALAWTREFWAAPGMEPSVIHRGVWHPETRSVHVTDPKSMNDLWCQGFFGKGSLSRSEPSWLNREKARRGNARETSEQRTSKRREERADSKWERGRLELEAIEQKRREEAQVEALRARRSASMPVNPSSNGDAVSPAAAAEEVNGRTKLSEPGQQRFLRPPIGPLELLALPNSDAELALLCAEYHSSNAADKTGSVNGEEAGEANAVLVTSSKAQKSVRFATGETTPKPVKADLSDTVSEATESLSPTAEETAASGLVAEENKTASVEALDVLSPPAKVDAKQTPSGRESDAASTATDDIVNKEHLQLSREEAFFLAYGLGALVVLDPETHAPIPTQQLFRLFRQYGYFPPKAPDALLAADDPFLIHYAVYHHFRSLGWVPRHGIKFGVDWLLYAKGPALDHAEFGVMVVPSYTDPWWSAHGGGRALTKKPWHWLHSVNRVLSTVFKSFVLVYVDIPPPAVAGCDISALLAQFKIREVMVRRWSSNRNRD